MIQKVMAVALLVAGVVVVGVEPALADTGPLRLPAPGILALVAMGVIGAVALARSRK